MTLKDYVKVAEELEAICAEGENIKVKIIRVLKKFEEEVEGKKEQEMKKTIKRFLDIKYKDK